MNSILQEILDWSEAWALLIPLAAAMILKPAGKWTKPVIWFLVLAFLINLTSDVIWKRYHLGLADWMSENFPYLYNAPLPTGEEQFSNQVLYNIHSIIRFIFFALFFGCLNRIFRTMNFILIPLFIIVMTTTFTIYYDIRDLSNLLMATDATLLLVYCLVYYFLQLKQEESLTKNKPHFWAVLGLSIYVVVNFPIFLFYNAVTEKAENFAISIWSIHNISYIIFCIFLAKAFHAARSRKGLLPKTEKL